MRQVLFLMIIMLFFNFLGCKENNKKYPVYSVSTNTELGCVELLYEGITYRPYGILPSFNKFMSKQIGIIADDPNSKIYELKWYDSREWVVDYIDVFMGGNMLFKSIDVIEIPKGLEKYKVYDF